MKFVSRFLFEFDFTVVCSFAGFVSCFGLMKFVSRFLCEFDFGVVCCFAGFVLLFALSFSGGLLMVVVFID